MKKNFVRFLTVMVVGIMLTGCGKQQGNIVAIGEDSIFNLVRYMPTDEELDNLYKMALAEADLDSKRRDEYVMQLIMEQAVDVNYHPSDEERQYAYLVAYAMTRDEEAIIQTMGTNVAINIAKREDMNLIDVFNVPNLFSGIHDGVPSIQITNEDGKIEWIPVTEDMLTYELKEAVDLAFTHDYTDGALHYYNIHQNHADFTPQEFIQKGDWIFFKDFK